MGTFNNNIKRLFYFVAFMSHPVTNSRKFFFKFFAFNLETNPRKNFQANFFLILCEKIRHVEKFRIS